MWTGKFLNPERKSCGLKNIRIRVDGALVGFHAGPLSWLNWDFGIWSVFVEGRKPENPEKNPRSKDENQQQTQPTYDAGFDHIQKSPSWTSDVT